MAVPKQRKTKSRRNSRRSHNALTTLAFATCPKCGEAVLPHNLCENCGTYQGREHVNVLAKLEKREKKQKQKELSEQEKTTGGASNELSMEELSKK
ncbi:MAG: 50S ribosomal protein L32 [Candidatus Spechtbacteria bacterium RIFCSPLOWO2_01_FULL_43_12]|uniref:Large ribosomal subunit protein bL32 n=1 Tax=Candidatus Spechtbacteria bacterium RIFCSPLOWO2_01_FULL_43_12 TaxID=1802162 RepID=A0A1G2HFH5_9BACT|nr:MAG: 50S ribosomal protein L32 [Candidatus Spechtbacteria bacterium RIFCSPLOWO2_01_FULL_43_12]